MAEQSPFLEIINPHDDDSALRLVMRDLHASDRFKRDYWPTEKIQLRRRVYEGDPTAFNWPYVTDKSVSINLRPIQNWIFRQINHKVGKLCRTPTRLNLKLSSGLDDDDTRVMLEALKQRILRKSREMNWSQARRRIALDAAKTGLGVRFVGLVFDGVTHRIKTWPVRAEEFHMDPTAESIHDAVWVAWRRYVLNDKIAGRLAKHPELSIRTTHNDLTQDPRGTQIMLHDDQILARIGGPTKEFAFSAVDVTLVTDYWRRDPAVDVTYECTKCAAQATMGRVRHMDSGQTNPVFQCQHCGNIEKTMPARDSLKQQPRYPFGRHISIIGPSSIDYNGPNRLEIKDIFPFITMVWYDGEYWPGYSETEQLQGPAVMNNLAYQMLQDEAFSNAHPKMVVAQDSIIRGNNNDPDIPIELSLEGMSSGGVKTYQPGTISDSVKILREASEKNMFLLAANSPESQGQAPETIRSGVGIARVISASDVGLYLTSDTLCDMEARAFRIIRDLCRMADSSATIMVKDPTGQPMPFPYQRQMMQPDVEIEVLTDRDVDDEREEIFSRALDLKTLGDPKIDFDMLERLSGIPADILQEATQRLAQMQAAQSMTVPPGASAPSPMAPTSNGEGPPAPAPPFPSPMPGPMGGPPAPAGNAVGNGGEVPGPIRQRLLGARTPGQQRPPSRSRGSQIPRSPLGGGGVRR